LFQIILEYLADNIDLVEGLKGLPEIVGEQLAAEVLKKQPHKTFKKVRNMNDLHLSQKFTEYLEAELFCPLSCPFNRIVACSL